ncbi:MAG: hypothetical protein ACRDRA_04495 [Pseudonocardiaceae bacterium]
MVFALTVGYHLGAVGDQVVGVLVRVGSVHPAAQGGAGCLLAVPARSTAAPGGCRSAGAPAGKGRTVVDGAGGGALCREVARGAGTVTSCGPAASAG